MVRLFALPLLLLAASGAGAQAPLTETQLRAMPSDELARRLLGDFAAVVYPLPPDPARPAGSADGRIWLRYYTRPRASSRPGVCETDFLHLSLEPAGEPGPERPLGPRSISTSATYFLGDVAQLRQARAMRDETPADAAVCAAHDPRRAQIVVADNAEAVGDAAALVADLLDAARTGRTPAPITCRGDDAQRLAQYDCLARLAALRTETLHSVELVDACWGSDRRDSFALENRCWRVWLWDARRGGRVEISFALRWGPQELVRIEVRPRPGLNE